MHGAVWEYNTSKPGGRTEKALRKNGFFSHILERIDEKGRLFLRERT